jgi:hypothetical protein
MSEETKTENLTSQSKFAKLCGVSPEAVRKAIVAGKIDAIGEGRKKRILLAGVNTIGYLNDKNSQRKNSVKSQPAAAPASVSISEEKSSQPAAQPPESKPPFAVNINNILDFENEDIDLSQISQNDLKKLQVLESTKKNAQERKTKRGDLIERKLLSAFLGKIYTIEVNQLKPIADKSPSKIAAIFENEDAEKMLKVSQILADDIAQALNHIQHTTDRFLDSINKNFTDKENVPV